jgi:hypothetical protein
VTLTITDTLISSDLTRHFAQRVDEHAQAGWLVSWLPDRLLALDQAEAALELAEIVAKGRDDPNSTNYAYFTWVRIAELTRQLGLQGLQAVAILEEWPTGKEE